jgi:hypothetical protein
MIQFNWKVTNNLDNLRIGNETSNQSEYVCEKCGMNFGNSLGDMELHKTIVHLQDGDISTD